MSQAAIAGKLCTSCLELSSEIEACAKNVDTIGSSIISALKGSLTYGGSRQSLARNLSVNSKESLLINPHAIFKPGPITTSIFDLFKVGPGPSSSHTIGPMKAAFDYLQDLRQIFEDGTLSPKRDDFFRIEIHLHGSLSATGKGHGTDIAVVGGLMGWLPPTCDPETLRKLMTQPGQKYRVPVVDDDNACSETDKDTPKSSCTTDAGDSPQLRECSSEPRIPHSLLALGDSRLCVLERLLVGADSFVWNDPAEGKRFAHPNTLILRLLNQTGKVILEGEYYSVGGGFVQKKGCDSEDSRPIAPKYPYTTMDELKACLSNNKGLAFDELLFQNEETLTGADRPSINRRLDEILLFMEQAVGRGLRTNGVLPGPIGLQRKAQQVYDQAMRNALRVDNILTFLNAYCLAASEENAAGNVVVTAPTSGASGVFPGLIYFMKHHMYYSTDVIRRSLMVGGAIGFLVKRNASISGAEMGCMGEIGTAAAMGAAMLMYAAGGSVPQVEAAAEIAIEHHLGLTCDPIGGYVQIPCIQRNPMGAVKAYNAHLLASTSDPSHQKISLDCVIKVMKQTGEDMSNKYKETSEAGLAMNFTEC